MKRQLATAHCQPALANFRAQESPILSSRRSSSRRYEGKMYHITSVLVMQLSPIFKLISTILRYAIQWHTPCTSPCSGINRPHARYPWAESLDIFTVLRSISSLSCVQHQSELRHRGSTTSHEYPRWQSYKISPSLSPSWLL